MFEGHYSRGCPEMITTNCAPRHYGDPIPVIRRHTPASHFYNEVHFIPICGDALYRRLRTYKVEKYPKYRAQAGAHAGRLGLRGDLGKTKPCSGEMRLRTAMWHRTRV